MDFEDRRPLNTRDVPKVLAGFALVLAIWPWVFPPAHPLVAMSRLQSLSGNVHRIERSDADQDQTPTGGGNYYYPGSLSVVVLNGGGLHAFSMDNREAAQSPGLQRLHTGDEVSLLYEPQASGPDRLWELKHHDDELISYATTRRYVENVYGDPPFWCRVFALLLFVVAAASAWLMRNMADTVADDDPRLADIPLRGLPARLPETREAPPSPRPPPRPLIEFGSDGSGPDDGIESEAPDEAFAESSPAAPEIPPVLADVAATHAVAVLLALLLDDQLARRLAQQYRVRDALGEATCESMKAFAPACDRLDPSLRTALAQLALPALRELPASVTMPMRACVDAMVRAEDHDGLSRYLLGRLVHRACEAQAEPVDSIPLSKGQREAIARWLAVVAKIGHTAHDDARRAYAAGIKCALPGDTTAFAPPAEGVAALDTAWDALAALDARAREKLIDGTLIAIGTSDANEASVRARTPLMHALCALLLRPPRA